MADEQNEPKTVKVRALQAHSAFGKDYAIGDEYEIEEQFLDTVVQQGKAARADDGGGTGSIPDR